jgi:hypothetical protein
MKCEIISEAVIVEIPSLLYEEKYNLRTLSRKLLMVVGENG